MPGNVSKRIASYFGEASVLGKLFIYFFISHLRAMDFRIRPIKR